MALLHGTINAKGQECNKIKKATITRLSTLQCTLSQNFRPVRRKNFEHQLWLICLVLTNNELTNNPQLQQTLTTAAIVKLIRFDSASSFHVVIKQIDR